TLAERTAPGAAGRIRLGRRGGLARRRLCYRARDSDDPRRAHRAQAAVALWLGANPLGLVLAHLENQKGPQRYPSSSTIRGGWGRRRASVRHFCFETRP